MVHNSLGQEQLNTSSVTPLKVDRDGQLHIQGMQPLQAWNRTLDDLNKELAKKNKFIYATLGRVRSIQINLAGEVRQPGSHRIPANSTAINALSLMGGIKKTGSLRRIHWLRGRILIKEIDLYDYLFKGQIANTLNLQSGDTLFVPLLNKVVAVGGSIRRPGIYEIQGRENFTEVIKQAGGILPGASLAYTQLERRDSLQGVILKALSFSELEAESVQDHDIIKVMPRSGPRTIRLEGEAVENPGVYPLLAGARLEDIIIAAGGLKQPESTDSKILISRWNYSKRKTLR